MADNEKEEQNQNVEEEENEIEGDLIVEEGEDDELVKYHLILCLQGLDVDLEEISKQCEGFETQVKVRDPSKQVRLFIRNNYCYQRQKFDSASYEKERQEKRKSKEQKLNNNK